MNRTGNAQSRKHAYLKPIRYRVSWVRRYEQCGLAQDAGSPDMAFAKLFKKYGAKYLPNLQHKKAAVLCYRVTKMLLNPDARQKPTDKVFYVQSATSFNGLRVKIEMM